MEISDFRGGSSVAARTGSGKLFQAYIISGCGEGKTELAKRIAAQAVCSGDGQAPCSICADCRKAASGVHPDIIFVEPPMSEKEHKDYQVDTIRKMCADSAVVPNDASRKVYIITDASKLSTACQNVLLKTLEEPPTHAIFIIISENSGNLLITVRSRCVELGIPPEKNAEYCSEEIGRMASGMMKAIAAGRSITAAEYLLSLENISKSEMSDLSGEMLRRCTAAIRDNVSGKDCGISVEKLLHMTEVFTTIRKYLDYNVSTGHIIGLLMAELL